MRIPRTFTLPVALVEKINAIPSGERSRFVERALEDALGIKRPAVMTSTNTSQPPTSTGGEPRGQASKSGRGRSPGAQAVGPGATPGIPADPLPPTPLPKIAKRK